MDLSVYLVTDSKLSRNRSNLEIVRAALAGGVTFVQYREKDASTRVMLEQSRILRDLCRDHGIPFIVNDRVDVALAVDADGVHVGQDDMPLFTARGLMGPHKIVGVSAGNLVEAQAAEADGADYIGASPIFATPTKPDAPKPVGMGGLSDLARSVSIPVVAIGGLNASNAGQAILAGAAGVAVVSALVSAEDVEMAARELRRVVDYAKRTGNNPYRHIEPSPFGGVR